MMGMIWELGQGNAFRMWMQRQHENTQRAAELQIKLGKAAFEDHRSQVSAVRAERGDGDHE